MSSQSKKQRLTQLRRKMLEDETLPLRAGATNLVFADGTAETQMMFIGEGPGYWEDQKSLPFVGNAGAFLNQLLAMINLKRTDVFITNVVHHRPPNNRDPEPQELKAYGKYLDEMIKILDPKIIITLGRFSMAKFLPGVTISQVHGKPRKVIFDVKEILVIPMYHPAAGLRNGNIKSQMIEDFKKLPDIIKKSIEEMIQSEEKQEEVEQMNLL